MREQHHSRGVMLVSVLASLAIILAALAVSGCGGSGSSVQGDKPVGDGQNVQKSLDRKVRTQEEP